MLGRKSWWNTITAPPRLISSVRAGDLNSWPLRVGAGSFEQQSQRDAIGAAGDADAIRPSSREQTPMSKITYRAPEVDGDAEPRGIGRYSNSSWAGLAAAACVGRSPARSRAGAGGVQRRARIASTMPRCGESEQTGSVAAASCASRKAWQRQPPKSCARRSQVRQRSGIQSSPRNFWNASEFSQISRSERFFDIFKRHSGQDVRGVAGQHVAIGLDEHALCVPSRPCRAWDISRSNPERRIRRVIRPAQPLFGLLQDFERAVELRARGQQTRRDSRTPSRNTGRGRIPRGRARFFRQREHVFELVRDSGDESQNSG